MKRVTEDFVVGFCALLWVVMLIRALLAFV